MRYQITQTLIGSWVYLSNCRDECKEDAYNDFLNTLNRIPTEPNEAMQNGLEFEKAVYAVAKGDLLQSGHKWANGISSVATAIKGAQTQVKASRELRIGDMTLFVYGILDALKAGTIYDVKFLNKSFGSAELAGKYLDSPQHPTYFYIVPEAREFIYLVSDGEDLYTERYTRENSRPFEEVAREFLASLAAMNLLDTYKEKWALK